ncbi:MAG TPA: hypothetical protein VI911_11985 [Patescibacteria group bacterium]|nr:hypothetical protein [Patescibacteria group bacterium]
MENINKKYTAAEAAIKILDHVKKMYQNSNLKKSNTAHEIEAGSEPVTQNTECPEQLAASKSLKSAKKKHNDSGNTELDGESEDIDNEDVESEDGEEIPDHEQGLSPEEKEIHDSTESESDEEELEQQADAEAHERDEYDDDDIEEESESPEQQEGDENVEEHEKLESEVEDNEKDEKKDGEKIIDKVTKDKKPAFMKAEVDKACGLKSPKLGSFLKKRELKKAIVDEGKSDDKKREDRIKRGNDRIVVGSQKVFGRDKGVHKPYHGEGSSNVGEKTRFSRKYKEVPAIRRATQESAKDEVKLKINEQKQMKKPNLPKSEEASLEKAKPANKPSKDIKHISEKRLQDRDKFKEQREAGKDPIQQMRIANNKKKAAKKVVIVDKERGNKQSRKVVATKKVEKMLGMSNLPSNSGNPKDAYKKPETPKPPKVNEGY